MLQSSLDATAQPDQGGNQIWQSVLGRLLDRSDDADVPSQAIQDATHSSSASTKQQHPQLRGCKWGQRSGHSIDALSSSAIVPSCYLAVMAFRCRSSSERVPRQPGHLMPSMHCRLAVHTRQHQHKHSSHACPPPLHHPGSSTPLAPPWAIHQACLSVRWSGEHPCNAKWHGKLTNRYDSLIMLCTAGPGPPALEITARGLLAISGVGQALYQ